MTLCATITYPQGKGQISGRIVGEDQQPLIGATVVIQPINKATIADSNGNYLLDNFPLGKYNIQISFIGYKTISDSLTIASDTHYNTQLRLSSLSLQEVVVKDHYAEQRKKEESLNIEIVNEAYLKQNLGGSLVNSLERLPGVSSIDIGSGQAKPVIRGLSFNRVVVVENNIKHEAQQWGADHGLEIDQYAVDNVEVIKGPASLMYGSDAIGGVIDMKNRSTPSPNSFGGSIDLSGKTNNDFIGTSVKLYARKNWFYASLRATLLDYGDYRVPTDSVDIYSYRAALHNNHLRNTAGKEQNLHLSLGIIKDHFHNRLYFSNVRAKNGFFANAHGLKPVEVDTDLHDKSSRDIHYPYHKVNHFKAINNSTYNRDKLKLELNIGYQHNFRQEWSQYTSHGYMPPVFPDTLEFPADLEREYNKYVISANMKASYHLNDHIQLLAGMNGEYQNNNIDGRGFIIPAFMQFNIGAFAIGKYKWNENQMVQAGVRYDYGQIQSDDYYDWFQSPVEVEGDTIWKPLQRADILKREFSSFTWSMGYNYGIGQWSHKLNVGTSFRMPIAKELAANGINYHRFSYEKGNPDLAPEASYQVDYGTEYARHNFAIGFNPFLNYFNNYIYLNPTPDHDRLYGNGHQIFEYTQSKVFRYGLEVHSHYELFNHLQVGIIGEYVYSEQLSGAKKGYTLPFSPPSSAVINLKYHRQALWLISNTYLSMDFRLTAAQNHIVPPEKPTDGYQLVNLNFGGEFKISHQPVIVSAQLRNIFNTKYFNHTSYYRLINVPEAGRNFIINVSIPFSGK